MFNRAVREARRLGLSPEASDFQEAELELARRPPSLVLERTGDQWEIVDVGVGEATRPARPDEMLETHPLFACKCSGTYGTPTTMGTQLTNSNGLQTESVCMLFTDIEGSTGLVDSICRYLSIDVVAAQ